MLESVPIKYSFDVKVDILEYVYTNTFCTPMYTAPKVSTKTLT